MKITSIDVFLVTIGQPSVPGSPWNPVVVRINTDDTAILGLKSELQ